MPEPMPDLIERARPHMDHWEAHPAQGAVARALVHKHRDMNVAVARIATLGDDCFVGQLHVARDNPFFFDHPVDHVPGLLLVEAARQFGLVVAHECYGVPLDAVFTLSGMEVDFGAFAELDAPTFILGQVTDPVRKRGALRSMTFGGGFLQSGQLLGEMTGRWRMTPRALFERMRSRVGR